jgi:hypothetical protein
VTLETVNGIFRSFACCSENSFPSMENYEVEHDFPNIGRRTMLSGFWFRCSITN